MKRFILLLLAGLTVSGATTAYAQDQSSSESVSVHPPSSTAIALTADDDADGSMQFEDYRVMLDTKQSRLTLGMFGQMSQFQREGISLIGYTFEILAGYAMSEKLAIQMAVNQAMSMDGGITVLFTGIRSSVSYALFGDFIQSSSVLQVNGRQTISVRPNERPLFSVDGGVDQYLFNGISRIVPATGVSVGSRYDRSFWNVRASLVARYGMLVISEAQVPMMTLGAGLLFRF